jgi:hypothetical protein
MNRANYTGQNLQRFPLSTAGLDFMQQQALMAAEYAKAAGGNYRLLDSTNATDGLLVINGEIIPLAAGPVQSKLRIDETTEDITADSGNYPNAYPRRKAVFDDSYQGGDAILWETVQPFPTNKYLRDLIQTHQHNGGDSAQIHYDNIIGKPTIGVYDLRYFYTTTQYQTLSGSIIISGKTAWIKGNIGANSSASLNPGDKFSRFKLTLGMPLLDVMLNDDFYLSTEGYLIARKTLNGFSSSFDVIY